MLDRWLRPSLREQMDGILEMLDARQGLCAVGAGLVIPGPTELAENRAVLHVRCRCERAFEERAWGGGGMW